MKWVKSNSATCCLVTVMGDADVTSYRALLALEEDVRDFPYLVLDVAEMDFADTTFLRFLMRVLTYARERSGGSLHLVGVNRHLQRVLEVTGLSRKVTYESTVK